MSSNQPRPWKGVAIVALVIAILALGAVAATTITTSPSMSDDSAARIDALSEQLRQTEAKLTTVTNELTALREQLAQAQSAEQGAKETSGQDVMAAVHVAYIDVRSKLNQLESALAQGDMEAAHESFEDLQVTLAHVAWPSVLQHQVADLTGALEELHHPMEMGDLQEAKAVLEKVMVSFHDLRGAFYNQYLPSTMQVTPTFEIELTTEIPAFVGPDGQKNPTIHLKVGDVAKITLANGDGVEHDLLIDAFGVHSAHIREKGESTVVIFTAEKAGVFEYYCSVPGHKEAGMVGQIIVEGASHD